MTRTPTLLASAVATAALAAFMLVSAVLTVVAQPSGLGLGIALVLAVWGAFVGWAAWGIARARGWARGPVVAAGLLHAASFGAFVPSQPWALVPAALGAGAAVTAVLPASTRALHLGASAVEDAPPTP